MYFCIKGVEAVQTKIESGQGAGKSEGKAVYFAPLEGLTDSVYRRIHHRYFPGVTAYFMPFFSPTVHRSLTGRESRELPLAEQEDFLAIPQLMTKNQDDCLWAVEVCRDRGYREVNLNLGCPSGTVVSKGKGAGMLADPEQLARFLDGVCGKAVLPISVKTRLGTVNPEEFYRLLEIFNDYPLSMLTVHPRVRSDFYKGDIRMKEFGWCMEQSRNPVCYNGGLTNQGEIDAIWEAYPKLEAVMVGRGLIGDPGMLSLGGSDVKKLEQFHAELLEGYTRAFGGSRNAMFRLKENWRYLLCLFEGSENLGKRLRKTTDLAEYQAITAEIFHTLPKRPQLAPDW